MAWHQTVILAHAPEQDELQRTYHQCYFVVDGWLVIVVFLHWTCFYSDWHEGDEMITPWTRLKSIMNNWCSFCVPFLESNLFISGSTSLSESMYTGSIFWPLPSLNCCINSKRADSKHPRQFCFSPVSTATTNATRPPNCLCCHLHKDISMRAARLHLLFP